MLCRVKELSKEAAKRSNSSLSSASQTAANVPQRFETAPDIVPRSVSKQLGRKPSLFHPSNIQLSSTPMKDGTVRTSADVDFNSLLLDGENDLPISGHHLSSGSSTNYDHRLDRISPIPDQLENGGNAGGKSETDFKSPGNEAKNVEQEQTRNGLSSSEPDMSNHKRSLVPQDGKQTGMGETDCERVQNEPTSPCSCRSLNSSYVGGQLPSRVECDCSFTGGSRKSIAQLPSVQNLPSPHRLVSSGTDSRQLFAETKARMASARTNISDFLQSEKSRTADSSFSSKPAPISRDMVRDLGINRHVITESQSCEWSIEKLPPRVHSLGNAAANFDGVTCPPVDAVSMETASLSGRNMLSDNSRQRGETSGRSWAEILEQSSHSCGNRSGAHVMSAPLPDLSCSGDDVVTPEMLESLKTRIKELKRRQDQLERDQLLSTQDCPQTTTTNPSLTTSTGTLVTNPGSQPVSKLGADFGCSGVPVSNREDEVAASQNVDSAHLQYGLRRTTAARSLMFEFTNPINSSKLPAYSTSNVVSPANDSGISSNTHTAAFVSDVVGCGRFLPNSQTPVHSSSTDLLHVVGSYMPPADAGSYAVQRLVRETAATVVVDASTNSDEQLLAMPLNSLHGKPEDNLQTCITNDSLNLAPLIPNSRSANPNSGSTNMNTRSTQPASVISNNEAVPNTGSANPNTGFSSMQPVSVISNDDAIMAGGQVHHSVADTVVVSSGNAGVISTATVARSNCLSSHSCENLNGSFQFAMQSATTVGGTAAASVLVGSRLNGVDPNSITFARNSVLNPTPVSCAVSSKVPDHQSESSVANACEKGASLLQQAAFNPSQTLCNGGNPEDRDDVKNFPHISNGALDLPGSAFVSDMIQQSSEDKARQHLQSVYKLFAYLCRMICRQLTFTL